MAWGLSSGQSGHAPSLGATVGRSEGTLLRSELWRAGRSQVRSKRLHVDVQRRHWLRVESTAGSACSLEQKLNSWNDARKFIFMLSPVREKD